MFKKAQGISLNVVVIAALALLVLVILSVVFIGRMGFWGDDVNDCINKGGVCAPECGTGDAANYPTEYGVWRCDAESGTAKKCCIAAS